MRVVQQHSTRSQESLAMDKNLTLIMVKRIFSTRATGTNLAMKAVMLCTQVSTQVQLGDNL